MIFIKSLRNYGDVKDYDEVWAIVRNLKQQMPGIRQVMDLSPSWALFGKYRELHSAHKWNENSFRTIYVPQFLYEMKNNSQTTAPLLNYLWQADKDGKNIALLCFCEDEALCHRSIVAGLLQGVGANVKAKADYSHYYDLFLQDLEPTLNQDAPSQPNGANAFRGDKYFLSNMYPCPVAVTIYGTSYIFESAESAYHAMKCVKAGEQGLCDENTFKKFIGINGYDAKRMTRQFPLPRDWDWFKMDIMKEIIRAKFTQNPELMKQLKAIDGPIIEQNTWGDVFWGTCNGKGQNHLGSLLMQMRDGTL